MTGTGGAGGRGGSTGTGGGGGVGVGGSYACGSDTCLTGQTYCYTFIGGVFGSTASRYWIRS